MGWLFNLLYAIAWIALSPWCLWRVFVRRKPIAGLLQKFHGRVRLAPSSGKRIWLHAVSVGEVNLLVHLVPHLQRRFPGAQCVVSTTTQTGYDLALRRFGAEKTFYLPLDFTWSVSQSLDRIQPDLIVLAELEIWPNLLRIAEQRNIPVAVINGRLSHESFRTYRRFRWLLRASFAKISWVGAQNSEYAARFVALGVPPSCVTITGNMKFDGAPSNRDNLSTSHLRSLLGSTAGEIIWIAGSTQDPEERIAIQCYRALRFEFPQLRLILAPRHPERCGSVVEHIQSLGLSSVRRTAINDGRELGSDDVLVIDTVGELSAWWGLCQIAYVGGSLGDRGGQNMIEPAAFGCAVSFGPNTKNFRDVVALLLANDAAIVVHDGPDLESFLRRCLLDPTWREQVGAQAQRLVATQAGATQQTVDQLAVLSGFGLQSSEFAA